MPNMVSLLSLCGSLLTNFTCAIQNVNSLNISTSCPKQVKKVNAICNLKSDIIFLSDTRLNTGKNNDISDLTNSFLYSSTAQYNLYHNSKGNSRGVCILISTNLDVEIVEKYSDEDDNVLGLLCNFSGNPVLLIGVYGPNTNTNVNKFFNSIRACMRLPHVACIIGGDWNLTYSANNSDSIRIF